jgi:hypothetical protein
MAAPKVLGSVAQRAIISQRCRYCWSNDLSFADRSSKLARVDGR